MLGPAPWARSNARNSAAGRRYLAEGTPARLSLPGRLLRILGRGTGGAGRPPARWRRRRRGIPFPGLHALPGLFRAWSIVRLGSGLPWPWSSPCDGGCVAVRVGVRAAASPAIPAADQHPGHRRTSRLVRQRLPKATKNRCSAWPRDSRRQLAEARRTGRTVPADSSGHPCRVSLVGT